MKQEEMDVLVPEKLAEIEKEYGVEVLWAVESGSRAWGFASEDSDFDVRFLYRRTAADYLALNAGRDVIELPVGEVWDVSGWDLDKALKLLERSNPTLYEWLNSPIVYKRTAFRERIDPLMSLCFCEERMLHHYLNTAKHNIADHLREETVIPKKYFYVLRPLLACLWIMREHTAPLVLFDTLCRAVLPEEMRNVTDRLLDIKMNSPEKTRIAPLTELNGWLDETVTDIEVRLLNTEDVPGSHWDELNAFFRKELGLK